VACYILTEDLSKLTASLTTLIAELDKRGVTPDIVVKMQETHRFIDVILNDYAQNGCRVGDRFINSFRATKQTHR